MTNKSSIKFFIRPRVFIKISLMAANVSLMSLTTGSYVYANCKNFSNLIQNKACTGTVSLPADKKTVIDFDHPACKNICKIANEFERPVHADYSPQFCIGSLPPGHIPSYQTPQGTLRNLSSESICLTVPPGKKISNIYCMASQDGWFNPSQGPCTIGHEHGTGCAVGWAWVADTVGNKQDDGSHVFCARYINESGDRRRFIYLIAE